MKAYPLKFKPIFKQNVWGGRALERYHYRLPDGPIGEAWMIGDHINGTTIVANGALQGMRLDEVRERFGVSLLGNKGVRSKNGRFPLLVKLLDCNDDLSIQVHPDDHYEGLPVGELGKTEMWYILDAKPDAKIVYGLKTGVTREQLAQAIANNKVMENVRQVSVRTGDSFYIPAGTVHALGAGILVAEVQQNSDTVYRLYDYERPGLDGKPRELHIDHSLNVITYDSSGASHLKVEAEVPNEWINLVQSSYFTVEKGIVAGTWESETSEDSFHMILVCSGQGFIRWGRESLAIQAGECLLLPACLKSYILSGHMTVIRSYLPSD